jgi:hypothetical protein
MNPNPKNNGEITSEDISIANIIRDFQIENDYPPTGVYIRKKMGGLSQVKLTAACKRLTEAGYLQKLKSGHRGYISTQIVTRKKRYQGE